jgi:ureidoglycolate lyase
MRLLTFATPQGDSLGLLQDDRISVADLGHASYRPLFADRFAGARPSLQAMLDLGLDRFRPMLEDLTIEPASLLALQLLTLRSPVPRPGKIIGAAYNFSDANAVRGLPQPAEPVTFFRSGKSAIGHGESILLPPDVGDVTYEGELAVVIGRRAIDVKRADAMRHVAGYTIHNDVSGTSMIKADGGRFVRAKNMPASSPLGPWFVSADEVPDPYAIGIRLDIDGRLLQDGSTATMLFDIEALIEFISHRMPLEPGDVIATGTPPGIAPSHTPPAWLAPGQTVTIELAGIGKLINRVESGRPYLASM